MADRLSNVVRRKFVDYFTTKHGHKFVKSSSVMPGQDKSLSFVNAGMNQFKPLFLADKEEYSIKRVCNYQKCIRLGGKTCDLNSVGRDFRHHTFFEMLGNWSFNDYGKQQACEWALDFLVNELKLDINKILVTYYSSEKEEDLETKEIWQKLGLSNERILANKKGDNFWEMGQSGPCGMSTELFYPVGDDHIEIWNLVFIDRHRLDGTDEIKPLRSRFVDTGMGLERILSVLEGVNSNYDTDLFKGMLKIIESKSDVGPYKGTLTDETDINYRILADHCRMITITLADGILPGRKGPPFTLRNIIKKTLLMSRNVFHQTTPRYLLFDLVDETVDALSEAYPELTKSVTNTRRILAKESKKYLNYLDKTSQEASTVIKIPNIKRALSNQPDQITSYIISGRVSNIRSYKTFNFIDLIDGSSKDKLQVIMDRSIMMRPELGSYLTCQGYLVPSKGDQQGLELKVEKVHFYGECNPAEYPFATRSPKMSLEDCSRQHIHLRPRIGQFASLLRVRSELEMALHMIMKQLDYFRVHTPILSSNDSEASSDLFLVNRSKIMNTNQNASNDNYLHHKHQKQDIQDSYESTIDPTTLETVSDVGNDMQISEPGTGIDESIRRRSIRRDYFNNKDVYLVTSAQLHLEALASSLSRVYTLSTAFRAEHSISTKHLCEFTMFEAEETDLIDLEPLMDRVESIIKFLAQFLSEVSEHRADFNALLSSNSNELIYHKIARSAYIRMSYQEALVTLRDKCPKFAGNTEYGSDIGRSHEQALLDYCDNVPIFITNYPTRLKPFYMKSATLDDKEALCFDLIAPFGGEICGGSLREDSYERLLDKLGDATKCQALSWYLDLRRLGTFPHGGFGIGIERLIQSLLGVRNIKDTIAFPRWPGHCPT